MHRVLVPLSGADWKSDTKPQTLHVQIVDKVDDGWLLETEEPSKRLKDEKKSELKITLHAGRRTDSDGLEMNKARTLSAFLVLLSSRGRCFSFSMMNAQMANTSRALRSS